MARNEHEHLRLARVQVQVVLQPVEPFAVRQLVVGLYQNTRRRDDAFDAELLGVLEAVGQCAPRRVVAAGRFDRWQRNVATYGCICLIV